jgi:signal transduction histidine kinase
VVIDIASLWAIFVVGVCGAVLVAMLWRRSLLSTTLVRLGRSLRASDRPDDVRNALAATLGDPTLELLYRDRRSPAWHDTRGGAAEWPRALPPQRFGSLLSDATAGSQVVMIHDVALRDDPELLGGVGRLVLAARRHQELTADLAAATEALDESGRRLDEAVGVERQRMERDLHDGAQQRLVALRIRLAIAEERMRADPVGGAEDLRALGSEVDLALDELRALARGAAPAPLADDGLVAALESLARLSPLPIRLEVDGVSRLAPELERAVYFTCAEALQNAIKHATGATGVVIQIAQRDGELRVEIRDDGVGFVPEGRPGSGLRNMEERIASVGGTLVAGPGKGGGTSVVASVPTVVEPTSRRDP